MSFGFDSLLISLSLPINIYCYNYTQLQLKLNKILFLNLESVIFIRLFMGFSYFRGYIYCKIFSDIKMEWGDKENRIEIIALHKAGSYLHYIMQYREPNTIFKNPPYAWY